MASSPKKPFQNDLGMFVKSADEESKIQCFELVQSAKGPVVWCGSENGVIFLRDARTGEQIAKIHIPGRGLESDSIKSILLVEENVWCGCNDGTIVIFNSQSGNEVTRLLGHTGAVNAICMSDSFIWSGSGDRTIRAWDPLSGQVRRILNGNENWVRSLVFYDGKIWSGSDDNTIRVWDEKTGALEQNMHGNGGVLCMIVVGRQIWVGSADKTVSIWDAQSCRQIKEMHGHNGWVTSLVYASGIVWSGSSDKTIRLWNAKNGNSIKVLSGHTSWVTCLIAVGYHIWSGSSDKSIRIWQSEELQAPRYDLSPSTNRNSAPRSPTLSNHKSPVLTRTILTPTKDELESVHSMRQSDYFLKQIEAENQKLLEENARLKEKHEDSPFLEGLRETFGLEIERLQSLLQEQVDLNIELEDELVNTKDSVERQFLLEKELLSAKSQLEELQSRTENQSGAFISTLDSLRREVGEESFRKKAGNEIFDLSSPIPEAESLGEFRKNYNHMAEQMDKKLNDEVARRTQRSHREKTPVEQLRGLKEDFEIERTILMARLGLEEQAKGVLERTLGKCEESLNTRVKNDTYSSGELDSLKSRFKDDLQEIQKKLELEWEKQKLEHHRQFEKERRELINQRDILGKKLDIEISKTEERELLNRATFARMDEESRQKELLEHELKNKLALEEKAKTTAEESNWDLRKKLQETSKNAENSERIASIAQAQLNTEMAVAVNVKNKFEEGSKQWKYVLDVIRRATDGQIPSIEVKEQIEKMAKDYVSSARTIEEATFNAKSQVERIHKESREAQEHLLIEHSKTKILENSNLELLAKLDQLTAGLEAGDESVATSLISDLFNAKKDCEEKMEEMKRRSRMQIKNKSSLEDSNRKLAIKVEKLGRELETEAKNSEHVRKKLEEELSDWKKQLELEIEKSMKRLSEEDLARTQLEEMNIKLLQELSDLKRQQKLLQTENRVRLDVDGEEKRQLQEANRKISQDLDEVKKQLFAEEKSKEENNRLRENEVKEWKSLVEQELAASIRKVAEADERSAELAENNRNLVASVQKVKTELGAENDDLRLKLENETKARMALENLKRDWHDLTEELKRNSRADYEVISELRDSNRNLQFQLEDLSRLNEKLAEMKKDNELKNRRIAELNESLRVTGNNTQEETTKLEKRCEVMKMKLEMESKLKEDMNDLKKRLEKELEEQEEAVSVESKKRKQAEEESWKLRVELTEFRRGSEEGREELKRQVESESSSRAIVEQLNAKLSQELEVLKLANERKTRSSTELEEQNKRATQELLDLKASYEEKIESLNQDLIFERNRRTESEESLETIQSQFSHVKDNFQEATARWALESSKRAFEKEIETKKRDLEKQLNTRRRIHSDSLPPNPLPESFTFPPLDKDFAASGKNKDELEHLNIRLKRELFSDGIEASFNESFGSTISKDFIPMKASQIKQLEVSDLTESMKGELETSFHLVDEHDRRLRRTIQRQKEELENHQSKKHKRVDFTSSGIFASAPKFPVTPKVNPTDQSNSHSTKLFQNSVESLKARLAQSEKERKGQQKFNSAIEEREASLTNSSLSSSLLEDLGSFGGSKASGASPSLSQRSSNLSTSGIKSSLMQDIERSKEKLDRELEESRKKMQEFKKRESMRKSQQ